ncbi:MAG: caspase family protein [Pseudomonadota bacterium]
MIETPRCHFGRYTIRRFGWSCLFLALAAFDPTVHPAHAGDRIALVIGNGDYVHADPIDQAASDMAMMADTLRSLDFDVDAVNNLGQSAMQGHFEAFAERIDQAGDDTIGLLFYVGHGFQLDGSNYLLPVDAKIAELGDVETAAINLDLTLAEIAFATNDHKLVILDVPDQSSVPDHIGARPGFAVLDAPVGTLVAFGTLPGIGQDGLRHRGLYPLALANVMAKPGLMVEEVFQEVRLNVAEATDGLQVPWESSSLTSPLYLAGLPEAKKTEIANESVILPASMDKRTVDLLSWSGIKDSVDPSAFSDYLAQFPEGVFRTLAARRLERLSSDEAASLVDRPASPEIESTKRQLITQRRSSVRASPSSSAVIVAMLEANEAVEVTGSIVGSDWLRVRLGDGIEAYLWGPSLGETPPPIGVQISKGSILPPSKAALLGQWRGEYQCQWDTIGFTLDITDPSDGAQDANTNNGLDAVFSFFPLPETPALVPGSFAMIGDYDPRDGTIILKSGDWIEQTSDLPRHDLSGRAEIGGGSISGRIETSGCSEFYLARDDAWSRSTVQSTTTAQ